MTKPSRLVFAGLSGLASMCVMLAVGNVQAAAEHVRWDIVSLVFGTPVTVNPGQSKGQPARDSSNTSADVAPSPGVPAQAPTGIQSAALTPEELVAGVFEAAVRGQADSFERYLAPEDRAYFAGLTAERKTEIVRLVRILFGLENSNEFVNDFEGTVRVSSRASRSLVLTLDGKFGRESFQGVGISFTHKGDASVVMARPGGEPWGQVDLLRTGNIYVLRNVRLLTPHPKTTTGFSDFIRGGGDFESIYRWYRSQVGGRLR